MYNFKKQKFEDMDGCMFSHPLFQRGQKTLIEKIKRKNPNKTKVVKPKVQENKVVETPAKIPKESNELLEVRSELHLALKKLDNLEKRVNELTTSNSRLVNLIERLEMMITPRFVSATNTAITESFRQIQPTVNLANLSNTNYHLLYYPHKNLM
mmetsp:Transcript_76740/g.89173  ORF Transcript_76740/g.89173 Transcript_76740/m.89173 type:complete len:154 (-) Transcript_76740:234-695(-)